jgi:hypothetical protein
MEESTYRLESSISKSGRLLALIKDPDARRTGNRYRFSDFRARHLDALEV